MWQLKKTGLCVGFIFLIELAKTFIKIKGSSSAYYFFIYNMLSCYQLLILLFAILTILMDLVIFRRFFTANKMKSSLVFLVFIIACESVCTFLLYHPRFIPGNPKVFIDYILSSTAN